MHLLLCLLGLLFAAPCPAQDLQARYTVFAEILGNAGIASLNLDTAGEKGVGFRVGGFVDPRPLFGCRSTDPYCREEDEELPAAAFLVVMGQRLVGESEHKLELGLGVLVGHAEAGVMATLPRVALTATLGYRLQPEVGRAGFRVGFTPIVAPGRVLLRPGFSLSYGLPTPR